MGIAQRKGTLMEGGEETDYGLKPYSWLDFGNNLISRDQGLIHPKTRPDMGHRASRTPRAILAAAGTVNIAGPPRFSGEGLVSGS